MSEPDPRRGPSAGTWAAVVLSVGVLLAALIYGPAAATASYVHDDHPAVLDNPHVSWPPDVAAIWRTPWFGPAPGFRTQGLSRPLVTLGYAVESGLGLASRGRHAVNLLLFGLVSGLVGLLVGALLRPAGTPPAPGATGRATRPPPDAHARTAALLATLLFALHPVHTSTVLAVAYRPELQACLFALLATLAFVAHVHGRRLGGALAVATLLLAVWSKESALTVTAAWGLWALTQAPQTTPLHRRRGVGVAVAALALTAGWLAWRHTWLGAPWVSAHDNPLGGAARIDRVHGALWLVQHAAHKLLLPLNLAPDETFDALPVLNPDVPRVVAGAAWVLGLAALAVADLRRGARGDRRAGLRASCVAWFGGAWLPVSHLLFPATVLFADRLLFLPSVAALGALAVALAGLISGPTARPGVRRAAVGVVVVLGGTWATVAHLESQHWTSELALFRHGATVRPRSLRMRFNHGLRLLEAGDTRRANEELTAALALDPTDRATWTLALQAASRLRDCGRVRALTAAPPAKPDDSSVKASVDAGVACADYGAAFRAGVRLRRPGAEFAKKVYVAGVAAGEHAAAERWARRFTPTPTTSPAWVAAAVFAERRAGRPARALARLKVLHEARPTLAAVVAQARQLCRARAHRALAEACARWPGAPPAQGVAPSP